MARLVRENLEHDGNGWRLRREMECPECGEFHVIDELEEKLKVSLYCDTYNKRIPLNHYQIEVIKAAEEDKGAVDRLHQANTNIPGKQGDRILLFEMRFDF